LSGKDSLKTGLDFEAIAQNTKVSVAMVLSNSRLHQLIEKVDVSRENSNSTK
jgi:hypothetical protein